MPNIRILEETTRQRNVRMGRQFDARWIFALRISAAVGPIRSLAPLRILSSNIRFGSNSVAVSSWRHHKPVWLRQVGRAECISCEFEMHSINSSTNNSINRRSVESINRVANQWREGASQLNEIEKTMSHFVDSPWTLRRPTKRMPKPSPDLGVPLSCEVLVRRGCLENTLGFASDSLIVTDRDSPSQLDLQCEPRIVS